MNRLTSFCVYTILDGKKLKAYEYKKDGDEREGKRWVTAEKLWIKAKRDNVRLPILFADARNCSRLTHWAILKKISIESDGRTHYSFTKLQKLSTIHKPQELILLSTGKNIAPLFIRPYALVKTPPFVETIE